MQIHLINGIMNYSLDVVPNVNGNKFVWSVFVELQEILDAYSRRVFSSCFRLYPIRRL